MEFVNNTKSRVAEFTASRAGVHLCTDLVTDLRSLAAGVKARLRLSCFTLGDGVERDTWPKAEVDELARCGSGGVCDTTGTHLARPATTLLGAGSGPNLRAERERLLTAPRVLERTATSVLSGRTPLCSMPTSTAGLVTNARQKRAAVQAATGLVGGVVLSGHPPPNCPAVAAQ